MAKQTKEPVEGDKVEGKKVEFHLTEEAVNILDNFFKTSLQAHAQGVLNYENAFFKSLKLVKESLIRKEV